MVGGWSEIVCHVTELVQKYTVRSTAWLFFRVWYRSSNSVWVHFVVSIIGAAEYRYSIFILFNNTYIYIVFNGVIFYLLYLRTYFYDGSVMNLANFTVPGGLYLCIFLYSYISYFNLHFIGALPVWKNTFY